MIKALILLVIGGIVGYFVCAVRVYHEIGAAVERNAKKKHETNGSR